MAARRSNDDAWVVDVAEYEQLRGEIDNRSRLANALVAVDLTALGLALASIASFPDAAIGIAAASTFLWMLWIDQASQTWKIAAYIAIELAPRLSEVHPGALGWETFVRRLDKGGEHAREALRLSDIRSPLPSLKTTAAGLYSSLLLGGAPLALLALGASTIFEDVSSSARIAKALASLASLLLWAAALHVYRRFRSLRSAIDLAIEGSTLSSSASHRETGEGLLADDQVDHRPMSPQEPT